MNTRKTLLSALLLLALGGSGWWGWSRFGTPPAPAAKAPMPVPVTVAQAVAGELPVQLEVVGRAEAYESVVVKSRIDGQVVSVAYVEGQHVQRGDVLLQLDPSDFQAKLAQAEANLARSQAQHTKSRADIARYESLKARGFVSEEKLNEWRTAELAAAATVRADQAAVDLARLQLSYTTIRAPFAGVVGARLAFPGSAVKTNDTTLAVVNRIQPLYISFAVPEKHLPRLRQSLAGGPLTVRVALPGQKGESLEATAKFIDNAVDAATGTIQMKAVLPNAQEKLTPGQFLNVSLTLETLRNAVQVPAEAVQQGQEGNFLYVVKPDQTVALRKVAVLSSHRGQTALSGDLAAGETVVTDGQLRLSSGALVAVRPSGNPEAAPAAPAPLPAPTR